MTKKTKSAETKETWLFKYYAKMDGGKLSANFAPNPSEPEKNDMCYAVKRGELSTLSPASLYEVTLSERGWLTVRGKAAPRYKGPWDAVEAPEYVALSQHAERGIRATKAEAVQRRKGMKRFESMTLWEAKRLVQKANFAGKRALKSQIDLYLSGAK